MGLTRSSGESSLHSTEHLLGFESSAARWERPVRRVGVLWRPGMFIMPSLVETRSEAACCAGVGYAAKG